MSKLEQFNLEEQIAEWRRALLSSKTIGPNEAAELEDHVRLEVERLSTLGIPQSEAFTTALQNVGAVDALAVEYGKVESPLFSDKRLQLALAGYLSITKARPIRLTQPVGLCGVGAIIALIFSITHGNPLFSIIDANPPWWSIAICLTGLEAFNQILARRFYGRAARRQEPATFTVADILINILCFLFPPLGLTIWLMSDNKSPQPARRAFRSAVRGVLVWLIALQYLIVYLLVSYAITAIGNASLTPIDPVKAERIYLQKKLLNQQKRGNKLAPRAALVPPRR